MKRAYIFIGLSFVSLTSSAVPTFTLQHKLPSKKFETIYTGQKIEIVEGNAHYDLRLYDENNAVTIQTIESTPGAFAYYKIISTEISDIRIKYSLKPGSYHKKTYCNEEKKCIASTFEIIYDHIFNLLHTFMNDGIEFAFGRSDRLDLLTVEAVTVY